ncbi:MAG: hypothetical protein LBL60_02060 [Mycoplasmataceae bacterium]|nr:hypothetical protein [Mycoplasmataceae bacterium]
MSVVIIPTVYFTMSCKDNSNRNNPFWSDSSLKYSFGNVTNNSELSIQNLADNTNLTNWSIVFRYNETLPTFIEGANLNFFDGNACLFQIYKNGTDVKITTVPTAIIYYSSTLLNMPDGSKIGWQNPPIISQIYKDDFKIEIQNDWCKLTFIYQNNFSLLYSKSNSSFSSNNYTDSVKNIYLQN